MGREGGERERVGEREASVGYIIIYKLLKILSYIYI